MKHKLLTLLCLGLIVMPVSAATTPPITVSMAGVPRYWGETQDYDSWFGELSAVGVTSFLPFSIYQEVPEPLALGYEADFFPPCSYDDPAFEALRKHNMKLLVAGQVLYGEGIPPLEEDPLKALMACTGEGVISAVLTIDEPGLNNTSADVDTEAVRAIYERVKEIDPNLPVMMVHAPIPVEITEADDTIRPVRQEEIDNYLANVVATSEYADMIGFDLYPIPPEVGGLVAPNLGVERVHYREAFPAYLDWLAEVAAGRPYFLVLQAFGYERQFSAEIVQEARDAGFNLRFPTEAELQEMACLAIAGGVSEIAWWGESLLIKEDAAFWQSVLTVTQSITQDSEAYCATQE
jgi:hypothetical protein